MVYIGDEQMFCNMIPVIFLFFERVQLKVYLNLFTYISTKTQSRTTTTPISTLKISNLEIHRFESYLQKRKTKIEDNWNLEKSVNIYNQTPVIFEDDIFSWQTNVNSFGIIYPLLHKLYKIFNLQHLTSIWVSGFFSDVIKHVTTLKTLRQLDNFGKSLAHV